MDASPPLYSLRSNSPHDDFVFGDTPLFSSPEAAEAYAQALYEMGDGQWVEVVEWRSGRLVSTVYPGPGQG